MFKWLHKLIQRVQNALSVYSQKDIPKIFICHCYGGGRYLYMDDVQFLLDKLLFPRENVTAFNVLTCNFLAMKHHVLIDGLIPAFVNGDKVGLYKVASKVYPSPYRSGNLSGWEGAMCVDLELMAVKSLTVVGETLLKQKKDFEQLQLKYPSKGRSLWNSLLK